MTVGNGSTSESATALMSSLNHDSGYGGSIASGSMMDGSDSRGLPSSLMEDRPTPGHTPTQPGEWNPAGMSFLVRDDSHFAEEGVANVFFLQLSMRNKWLLAMFTSFYSTCFCFFEFPSVPETD